MQTVTAKSTKLLTRNIPRFKMGAGIQITVTLRPDLGPVCDPELLEKKIEGLVEVGMSHARLNLSHFRPDNPDNELSREEYEARWRQLVQCIDRVGRRMGAHVFIMIDTAGPEFRITGANIPALEHDMVVLFSSSDGGGDGGAELPVVHLSMPAGFESFGEQAEVVGREISIADGECTAKVIETRGKEVVVKVKGRLELPPGKAIKVNFPGFDLQGVTSVGPSDADALKFFLTIPFEDAPAAEAKGGGRFVPIHYVAQSFVRCAQDVQDLKAVLCAIREARQPLILPKIETDQAAESQTLLEIVRLNMTAALIVARGDLGTECNRWLVPTLQRRVLRIAHSWLKPVIIATEVYGSMGREPYPMQPNRGEILDLRHALEAAVDGIMFTAETGARQDPETTVMYAARQANHDEQDIEDQDLHRAERDKRRERMEQWYRELLQRPKKSLNREDPFPLLKESDLSTMDWATSAVWRANTRRAAGIFSYTQSGNTARDMAHMLPHRPIFAITSNEQILARLALYRNVYPILVEGVDDSFDVDELKELVQEIMERFEIGHAGDQSFAMMAHPIGHEGKTDTLVQIRRT